MARVRQRLLKKVQTKQEGAVYRKIRTEVAEVNKMLRALDQVYEKPTYATEQLQSKLSIKSIGAFNKKTGRVSIKNLKLSKSQARIVLNALEDFKRSRTSTVRGVKSLTKVQRQELMKRSDNADWVKDLTDKEVEALHKVFDDKRYEQAMYGLDSDTAYQIMIDAKEYKMSKEEFTNTIITYSRQGEDLERRKVIEQIFTKYIK